MNSCKSMSGAAMPRTQSNPPPAPTPSMTATVLGELENARDHLANIHSNLESKIDSLVGCRPKPGEAVPNVPTPTALLDRLALVTSDIHRQRYGIQEQLDRLLAI